MHNAPSVTYPVGRSRFQLRLQCAVWWLGVAVVAAWCWRSGVPLGRQMLAGAAVLLAGAGVLWGWWRAPVGSLRWDGQQWFWTVGGASVAVRVHARLDLQRHLLLALQPDPGRSFACWVDCSSQPQRWRDLRRAVYSPARPLDPPLDPPGDGTLSAP